MNSKSILAVETLQDYSARLVSDLNIRRLGSGAYSHVFQHPTFSNVVVKIVTAKDRNYNKYLKWVLCNQTNPYAPQIFRIVRAKSPTDKYSLVFMEKMKPVSNQKFKQWLEFLRPGASVAFVENDYDLLVKELSKAFRKSTDKDLRKIWAFIKTFHDDVIDFHPGNVMLRGSQIVFTDPVGAYPGSNRVDDY